MVEEAGSAAADEPDVIEFVCTGTAVAGAYHCSACGYGVTVHAPLPRCPMCQGELWEPAPWSPFTRRATLR